MRASVLSSVFALLLFALAAPSSALAQGSDRPQGQVILEVSGSISNTNHDGMMLYDLDMLEALDAHTIETETPWTEGMSTFVGVLARDLIAHAGGHGVAVDAVALNDYTVTIPMMDFDAYDVIVAYMKDDKYLTVRDRGPLWVIYPWSNQGDLQNELYYSRSIWQLRSMEVRAN